MPNSNPELIRALRNSANNLEQGARYEWGHVGRCNCGHLVQTVCGTSETEIRRSFGGVLDEWSEHANDYCLSTGLPVEEVFDQLDAIGFSRQDVHHLEHLSDESILKRLPVNQRYLQKNRKEDVILYMNEMANALEEAL